MEWNGMEWDGMGWDEMGWDGIGWDGMGWDGSNKSNHAGPIGVFMYRIKTSIDFNFLH